MVTQLDCLSCYSAIPFFLSFSICNSVASWVGPESVPLLRTNSFQMLVALLLLLLLRARPGSKGKGESQNDDGRFPSLFSAGMSSFGCIVSRPPLTFSSAFKIVIRQTLWSAEPNNAELAQRQRCQIFTGRRDCRNTAKRCRFAFEFVMYGYRHYMKWVPLPSLLLPWIFLPVDLNSSYWCLYVGCAV